MEQSKEGRRRGRKRSDARKVLFWAAIVLVAGQLSLNWLVDHPWRRHRLGVDLGDLPDQGIQEIQHRDYVLCLGSSRLGCALNPHHVSASWHSAHPNEVLPFWNLSLPGATPLTFREIHAWLRGEELHGPRLLLLEVSPETLGRRDPFFYFDAVRHFTSAEFLAALRWNLRDSQMLKTVALRLNPAFGFRNALSQGLESWITACLPQAESTSPGTTPTRQASAGGGVLPSFFQAGSFGASTPDQAAMRIAREVVRVRKWFRNYQVGGLGVDGLHRFLSDLKSEQVPVILVAPPLSQAHRACYTADIEQAFQEHIRQLCGAHGCLFVDCRAWAPDAWFHDNHHLSSDGAQRFSEQFVERILQPFAGEHAVSVP